MLVLQEIVENITWKSDLDGYNPKTNLNWCDMPMEMRAECMKWMDFKTRTHLGATSKTEKSLVASKKYHFEKITLGLCYDTDWWIRGRTIGEDGIYRTEDCTDTHHKRSQHKLCISKIFTNTIIDRFKLFSTSGDFDEDIIMMEELVKYAPFQFKQITLDYMNEVLFFLSACKNLEIIKYIGNKEYPPFPVAEALTLPSVINAKKIRIIELQHEDFVGLLLGIAQTWIDNDASVGKSFESVVDFLGAVELFAWQFADRIIDESEKEVRIRMDDSKKQILIRCIGKSGSYEFTSCKVIPIDLPKSKYGIGDEWVTRELKRWQDKEKDPPPPPFDFFARDE